MENTNINNSIKISNSSFYYKDDLKKWFNAPSAYALDIALEQHFCDLLKFPLDRIIYASNDFCFREREKKNDGQLNLPFMNYYRTGYSETDRFWWNNYANSYALMNINNEGYYNKLGLQLRLVPIKAEYEATVFFNQRKDCEFAYHELALDESNETIIKYEIETSAKGENDEPYILGLEGIVTYDLEFNPTYNETDWLQQNNIWSIQMNFDVDTFMIYANQEMAIANEVILEFMASKNREDLMNQNGIIEYFELLN